MNKQVIKFFAVIFCVAALAAGARAASNVRSEFDVPFDFAVKTETFPAGKYMVEQLDANNPTFVVLRQVDGKARSIWTLQRTSKLELKYRLRLTFKRDADKYVLTGIWAQPLKFALTPVETGRNPRRKIDALSFILSPELLDAV